MHSSTYLHNIHTVPAASVAVFLSLVFTLMTWFMWTDELFPNHVREMRCKIIYTLGSWRHLTSNSHCNKWLPALSHTRAHTHGLTNSACSSRTRQLILITEQWKTSIITIICLLSRGEKKEMQFLFRASLLTLLQLSAQAALLLWRLNSLFFLAFFERMAVCLRGCMVEVLPDANC